MPQGDHLDRGSYENLRAEARAIGRSALAAVNAGDAVRRHLVVPPRGRLRILGAGKAAAAMAEAAEGVLGERLAGGIVVVPDGYGRPLARVEVLFAGHPVPDSRSERAGRRLLSEVARSGPDDVWLGLWSGGGSALIEVPTDGWTVGGIALATRELVRLGLDIRQLNTERTRWSAIKGGGLARAGRGRWQNLVLSDVAGDDPALVASGPTVLPGDGTVVVGRLADALAGARREAFALRYATTVLDPEIAGEASEVGERLATAIRALPPGAPPFALLLGGEPVVTGVPDGVPGGRMQELALAAALGIEGRNAVVLALSTDGRDGTTDVSGALVDGSTVARGPGDARAALAAHESHRYLDAARDLLRDGPTGTNVRDLVIALVR